MQEEIWKDVLGFEKYQVSNFGRVRSLKNNKPFIKKLNIGSSGYLQTQIYLKDKYKNVRVHQLVAEAFLGHKPNYYEIVVNHIDRDKRNNSVSNLELISNRENCSFQRQNTSSKYTGVFWRKDRGRWYVRMWFNGKVIQLGAFDDEYEAHLFRVNKLKELEQQKSLSIR